ncbi:MAG: hypothetical protein HUU15_03740 [Candidatus Brocadiae bacterium]|nr:hypothetical protein [Candidatus Brocadiia bacterium]
MQPYAAPPPYPGRSRFPFILTGCLVAFVTLCTLTVIGAAAAGLAFVTVASGPHAVSSGGQTADLFLVHMAAGRWSDASRLVSPELAGSVAAVGEDHKSVWGENRGCSISNTRSDVDWDGGGLRHQVKSTLQYTVKGTDGVSRKVSLRVQNGLITDLAVEDKPLFGNTIHLQSGCRTAPTARTVPAPVAPEAPAAQGREDDPVEVAPPPAPKKKSR